MLKVGSISSVHGINGAVVLQQIVQKADWLKKGDVLFVELKKDSFIPFFVSLARSVNEQECIVMFEDVEETDVARPLLGKTVYAEDELLRTAKVDSPLMYIGYNLVDKQKGTVGVVEDVLLIGKQWTAMLTIQGKEVLVPLVEDWIIEVNNRNKFIRIELPDGLLEVYLEGAIDEE